MKLFTLIPDWRLAWRFLSVQAAVVLALLSGIQAEVLPMLSPLVPAEVWPYVSGGLAMLIVLLRIVAQDSLDDQRDQWVLDALERDAQRSRAGRERLE